MKPYRYIYIFSIFSLGCIFTKEVFAVPPPDFLIQVASQLVTFFTLWVAILSGIAAAGYQIIWTYIRIHKKIIIPAVILSIIIIAWSSAYLFDQYYQKSVQSEYVESWTRESQNQSLQSMREIAPLLWETSSGIFVIASGKLVNEETMTVPSPEKPLNLPVYEEVPPIILPTTSWKIWDHKEIVSNRELKEIIESWKSDYMILDAREDIEYTIGGIPWSTHIRFADLKNGEWSNLPKDRHIYVICWSGMRGKEVHTFLSKQWVSNRYLEKWVDDWVKSGGVWRWEIKFSHIYSDPRYSQVLSTANTQWKVSDGVLLVDVRSPQKYKDYHISWSISVPLMETPSSQVDTILAQVPPRKKIITICDEYINCFTAKIVWIELEKRGAIFIGRYNKPWEWK